MLLILNEKPSQAKNFAKALGGMKGSFNNEPYKIFALHGHVVGFEKPGGSWEHLDEFPWDATKFKFKYVPGFTAKEKKSNLETLNNLKRELQNVDEVVIATDVDPTGEGELLAWESLLWCNWHGRTTRIYHQDESAKSIQKAFYSRKTLIDNEKKDGDYLKALARTKWDLLSVQFTRACTIIARRKGYNSVIRQGRLKSVMVDLVGKQLDLRKKYIRQPFFEVRFKDANDIVYQASDNKEQRFDSPDKIDLSKFSSSEIQISKVEENKHSAPPKLLDLASLSAILAAQGYKAEEVLSTYQKMYENQILSYPRTEDKNITLEQFNEMLPHVDNIAKVVGVDTQLLTHRQPRKTHVQEKGAHGANRPGVNVPTSLDSLERYGKSAVLIYKILARNFLAMFAEDYIYNKYTAFVSDYPDFIGESTEIVSLGFKEFYNPDKEKDQGTKGKPKSMAEPFIFEGCNKKPQQPTQKWLMKQLEKFNVGTGASRTNIFAQCTKSQKDKYGNDRQLIKESKGKLDLALCGEVGFTLMKDTMMSNPKTTERLYVLMSEIGEFKQTEKYFLNTLATMLKHDIPQMELNSNSLFEKKYRKEIEFGQCPRCGAGIIHKKNAKQFFCSTNKFKKVNNKWTLVEGCGWQCWDNIAHKTLSEQQLVHLLNGVTVHMAGLKSKTGKNFCASVVPISADPFKTELYFA